MLDGWVLEGIAREIHESTGATPPIDAFALAELCGVSVVPWAKSYGSRSGDRIRSPANARGVRQHGIVAHELGHWALEEHGEDPRDEDAANYLAGALMLPREAFLRDLAATDWELEPLRRIHANVSAQMIVVRMTQVSPACASVWDAGKLHRRYVGAGAEQLVDDAGDAAIVDSVLDLEVPWRDGLSRAWPVIDGRFRRVVVVRRRAA